MNTVVTQYWQHKATELTQQRDELLAACKYALPYIEATKAKSGTQVSSIAADLRIVRAAIANAGPRNDTRS